ncbi:ATP-dependent DNA helicase Q4 [Aricia agestis]|uniref:ATP-dependent DNA helicase Q4 n=1 Tax=Aricia agestis TaxID=91739 RepID=UPI001C208788|nr:ATP-dependent DNA helicase Q4 [Aricia agestis]
MDVIESIKRDKAYLKCKQIVKSWENDFKNKHSRTPSKFDIKEAPSKIKYAYKKYFHLKSAALESSLSICDLEEDCIGSPEPAQNFEIPFDIAQTPGEEIAIPELPSASQLDKLLSASKSQKKVESASPFTENLSKKLFHNRKFSIRNPRKLTVNKEKSFSNNSLVVSKNNIDSDFSSQIDNDNSTIISAKLDADILFKHNDDKHINLCDRDLCGKSLDSDDSKLLPVKPYFSSNSKFDDLSNTPTRHIDSKWIERATGSVNESVCIDNKIDNATQSFGLGNVTLLKTVEKIEDFVENSDSEDDIVLSKLKPALKKRKVDKPIGASDDRHLGTDTISKDIQISKGKGSKKSKVSPKQKPKQSKKSKEIKDDISNYAPPDITEFIPFGLKENVTPRHENIADILKTVKTLTTNTEQLSCDKEYSRLEDKIKNGTLNENFVKINIEKKVFVRGKKNLNYSKYKKKLWKDKKALHGGMEFPEGGKITCFKCSSDGHMARYCTAQKENALLPLDNYQENTLPTLEDMQAIVNKETDNTLTVEQLQVVVHQTSKVPDNVLKLLAEAPSSDNIKPIYDLAHQDNSELYEALSKFNHTAFRPGQEHAIKRILCGMSTLLILSTGGGKSLCYQLPAYIYSQHYKCVTLVISPLVSLMEDQVLNMPEFLKAGCLHTNQQPTQRRKIIECLKNGEINILLISPEALIAGDTSNGFTGLFKSLPPIAFACIDEAHCVSQWSHNFRPSYLMICRVLREKLNVKCILGLTATASQPAIKSIIDHINVPDGLNGVLTNPTLPDNLYLSMSFEKDKDKALVSLLTTEKISMFNSIIVYCIRRNECERVAAIVRSCLSQPGKVSMEKQNNKRKRMSYIAEAYHAGMSAAQRKKIQKHFMDGTLKIIVATVAFGMGINKSDIRCIIHYNMPPSFESYVQEVGRAGRDGHPAFCHVFLNNSSCDKDELLKHIYANSIDRPVIRKLIQKVFIPCKCKSDKVAEKNRCNGHEVGIPIDETVEELDLPSENIATLLCYVELHHKHYIKVLNNAYVTCKISSYGGPQKLHEAAKSCPPLAMAYLIEGKRNPDVMKNSLLEFNIIEVAAAVGWDSGMAKYHLKNLEWTSTGGVPQRSHLKVEFNTLGFRIKAPGDLSAAELDSMLDDLHANVILQEKVMLYQLEEITKSFTKLCKKPCDYIDFSEENVKQESDELKNVINSYFQRESYFPENVAIQERPLDVERVTADVRALIVMYKDCKFTGRSVARIFQGISSPNYPALVWGKCRFWRSHLNEDFYGIVKIATQQIIQMK